MKVRKDTYNWFVRLERGELLSEGLRKAIEQEGIKTGWIMGIGACEWVELGYYDLETKKYKWQKFDPPNGGLEILSLQGNVSLDDDQPMLHIHGTFSGKNYQSIGGHVKDLEVAGTLEIFLHDWFADPVKRETDPDTGLKLLDL